MNNVIGLDKASGKDVGVITEGYWLEGVFTVTKTHTLTLSPEDCKTHDFAATDGELDYCVLCGETRIHLAPSQDNLILIVAGNVQQAKQFAREHGIYPKYWDYVGKADELKGASGSLVYHGTYYERHDLKEIEAAVSANEAIKVLRLE